MKSNERYYIHAMRDFHPQIYVATLNEEGDIKEITSRNQTITRLSEDSWKFEFGHRTGFKKNTITLNFCDIEEISRAFQIWKDVEKHWFCKEDTFGEFKSIS